jgi:pyrimidine deaminase RibD-like protein
MSQLASTKWYDELMMRLAIEAAKRSPPIQSAYCVGAVLLRVTPSVTDAASAISVDQKKNGSDHGQGERVEVLTTGYSRELDGNTHAEECALLKFVATVTSLPSTSSTTDTATATASNTRIPSSIVLQHDHTLADLASLLTPVSSTLSTQLAHYYRSSSSSSSTVSSITSSLRQQLFDQSSRRDDHSHSHSSTSSSNTTQPYFVVYTTMEPCSHRLSGKVPCSHLISACGHDSSSSSSSADIRVRRVIVGVTEPDLFVKCTGIHQLSDGGIDIITTSSVLQAQCALLNRHLTDTITPVVPTVTSVSSSPSLSFSTIITAPIVEASSSSLLPLSSSSIAIVSH